MSTANKTRLEGIIARATLRGRTTWTASFPPDVDLGDEPTCPDLVARLSVDELSELLDLPGALAALDAMDR